MRVAILDDETAELQRLEQTLQSMDESQRAPWLTHCFCRGEEMLRRLKRERYDLLILDWQGPDISGLQILKWSREHLEDSPPVIMITSRDSEQDVVRALNAGADDYILKPVKPRVLVSRVSALLRRKKAASYVGGDYDGTGLMIDPERYVVVHEGKEMSLPKKEFELLSLLASQPGRVFTRENILASVWGTDVVVGDRTIDVHIRKLREKLGEHYFKTVKGVGYKFVG